MYHDRQELRERTAWRISYIISIPPRREDSGQAAKAKFRILYKCQENVRISLFASHSISLQKRVIDFVPVVQSIDDFTLSLPLLDYRLLLRHPPARHPQPKIW